MELREANFTVRKISNQLLEQKARKIKNVNFYKEKYRHL